MIYHEHMQIVTTIILFRSILKQAYINLKEGQISFSLENGPDGFLVAILTQTLGSDHLNILIICPSRYRLALRGTDTSPLFVKS